MKIAHIVESMEMGGAETMVSQMCHLQRAQGHSPCVYALGALGVLGERLRADGFEVRPNVGRQFQDSMRSFLRIFKESRPDVVHAHNVRPTYYAAMAAKLARVPSVVSTRHSLIAPPHRMIAELKYAYAARFCDWVVGICEATSNNLRGLHTVPSKRITRVYNGAVPLRRVEQAEWPAKSGFTLVFVGRLEPVKNHTLLLNGFRAALTSMPDLRLWMVGDGGERPMLEQLAATLGITEKVTFWGQQMDVAPFFAAADAFIMSSTSEGLPISLLQAFSAGLPSIVTDVGGMAEVVRLVDAGLTTPPNDVAAMGAAIVRLASDDAEQKRFATNAEQAFETRFTLQAMVDEYAKLYQSTMASSRTA